MAEYIEREAALNKLCRDNCGHDYNGKCYNCYTAAFIEQYPAADVAHMVHGKWIRENGKHTLSCSACKYDTKKKYKCSIEDFKHCPNCGARMDGE